MGRRRLSLAVAATLAMSALAITPAAAASPAILAMSVDQVTGTEPFDLDSLPGNDINATNNIVRTNDRLTYNITIAAQNAAASNVTFTLVLPRGVAVASVPPYCGAGSSLTPATVPYSHPPITATSWLALPAQTLVCNVGSRSQASTLVYSVAGRVRGEVPQGTSLVTQTIATYSGAGTSFTSTREATAFVSARPQFDLSINGPGYAANTGYVGGAQTFACPSRPAQRCVRALMPISLMAAKGGKGSAPLQNPITFTNDATAAGLFDGVLTPSQIAAIDADPLTYGAEVSCEESVVWSNPAARAGTGAPPEQATRDSGDVACSQAGVNQPLYISIANADSTASTVPSASAYPAGAPLSADRGYVAVGGVNLYIPTATLQAFGVMTAGSPPSLELRWTNSLRDFHPLGVNGATNMPGADPTYNDSRQWAARIAAKGLNSTLFVGDPGALGNTPAGRFMPGWEIAEGVSGTSRQGVGDGTVLAGQNFLSMMILGNVPNSSSFDALSKGCHTWNNATAVLASGTYGTTTAAQSIPSGGRAAWVSGYTTGSFPYSEAVGANQVVIEYGSGPASGGADCSDAGSPTGWFTDPSLVPGNDPNLVRVGKFSAVSKVRVFARLPGSDGGTYLMVSIGLEALANATGTIVPVWGHSFQRFVTAAATPAHERETLSAAELASLHDEPSSPFAHGDYDPSNATGDGGDRLILGSAIARVTNEVQDPSSGTFVSTGTTAVSTASSVTYRLSPTLSSTIASNNAPVTSLESCVPANEFYVVGSASVAPSVVQRDASPLGAHVTCLAGETYLRWNLGAVPVNTTTAPITFRAMTSALTPNGAVLDQRTIITAVGEVSSAAQRTAKVSVVVVNPTGIKVDNVATSLVNDLNVLGDVTKRNQTWNIALGNVGVSGVSDIDAIDVLPSTGLNGSLLSAPLSLVSFTTDPANPGTPDQLLYTGDPAATVSPNTATNTSTWCNGPTNGAVVLGSGTCPASLADVTAVRIQRTGSFEQNSERRYHLTMLAPHNAGGDTYVNRVVLSATNLTAAIGPVDAAETIASSTLSGTVWLDTNHDGRHSVAERGVASVDVRLTGTDREGNLVDRTVQTNSSGQYVVTGLASSDATGYLVRVDSASPAAGLGPRAIFTKQGIGVGVGNSDVDSSGRGGPVVLGQGETKGIDAGVFVPGRIGGALWFDSNANSSRETADVGIGSATATALWLGDNGVLGGGDDVAFAASTDATGTYVIDDLPSGTYQMSVASLDPALQPTAALAASVTLGDGLTSANVRTDINAGYRISFVIGDRVFIDTDANGRFNAAFDTAPPTGTVVQLLAASGTVLTTTATEADGTYRFSGLAPGDYQVQIPSSQLVGRLAGVVPTTGAVANPNNDVDEAIDHNATRSAGDVVSGTLRLSAVLVNVAGNQIVGNEPGADGLTNMTLDLGLVGPAGISVTREVCGTGTSCLANAAPGSGGWATAHTFAYGDPVQWRTVVTNTGLQRLSGVLVAVPTEASCSTGPVTLAVGTSTTSVCSTTSLLGSKAPSTATVQAVAADGSNVSATAGASAFLSTLVAHLSLTVSLNGVDTTPGTYLSTPGESLYGTVVIHNDGTIDLTGLTVSDDHGSAIVCPGGVNAVALLPAGGSTSCVFTQTAPSAGGATYAFATAGSSAPTALPDSSLLPGGPVRASAIVQIATALPAVTVTELVSTGRAFIHASTFTDAPRGFVGNRASWQFVVTNVGNVALINVVVAASQSGVACANGTATLPRLEIGESATCTAITPLAATGVVENAVVATAQGDRAPLPGQSADRQILVRGSDTGVVMVLSREGLPEVA